MLVDVETETSSGMANGARPDDNTLVADDALLAMSSGEAEAIKGIFISLNKKLGKIFSKIRFKNS